MISLYRQVKAVYWDGENYDEIYEYFNDFYNPLGVIEWKNRIGKIGNNTNEYVVHINEVSQKGLKIVIYKNGRYISHYDIQKDNWFVIENELICNKTDAEIKANYFINNPITTSVNIVV